VEQRGYDRLVIALSMIAIVASFIAAARYGLLNPLPVFSDEATYVNQSILDHRAAAAHGPLGAVKALLFNDPQRPPAYRALALAMSPFWTPSLTALRCLSLAVWCLALGFLWLAARAVSSPVAALLGIAAAFAMPSLFLAVGWYGTEPALYLAIALLLAALVRRWTVAIVFAVALGCLAKTSFLPVGGPAIIAALIIDRRWRIFGAALGGVVLALPWWAYNGKLAFAYARFAVTDAHWARELMVGERIRELIEWGFGPLFFIALIVLLACLRAPDPAGRRALMIAAAAVLPLLFMDWMSPNCTARHLSPALLPLAIVIAIAAFRVPRLAVLAAVLVALQAMVFAFLTPRLLPVPQYDWSALRPLSPKPVPRVAIVGVVDGFSEPEVRYAWLRAGGAADVLALANTRAVPDSSVKELLSSDIIVAPPPEVVSSLSGEWRLDNSRDAELISAVEASGRFARQPLPLKTLGGYSFVVLARK
jgi:hypothetical protein